MTPSATDVLLDTSESMSHGFLNGSGPKKYDFALNRLHQQLPRYVSEGVPFGVKQFDGGNGIETVLPIGIHTQQALDGIWSRLRGPDGAGSPIAAGIMAAADSLDGWLADRRKEEDAVRSADDPRGGDRQANGHRRQPKYSAVGRSIVTLTDAGLLGQRDEMGRVYDKVGSSILTGGQMRLYFLGLGRFKPIEIREFNKNVVPSGGGFFPVRDMDDEVEAARTANTVFTLAAADRIYAALLDQIDLLNKRVVELALDKEALVDRIDSKIAEDNELNRLIAARDRETRELIALLSEQAPLQADTVFRERFAPTFADALAAERTKEKRVQLFNSPFGWTVGAGFVGVLAVIGWATYALATNDRAMNANLDRVASIVSQLWEIWGR